MVITSFSDNLLLQIPYSGSGQPFVRLLSTADRYQLDNLALVARDSSQTYNFFFSTDILDRAGVEPSELRAIAYTDGGLYSPVLVGGLGTGSGYDIMFYANHDTKIKKFEIRRNG
ncbi:MAG: hypothetical protein HC795_18235, partial [Coleofasciculaceae cyanobacterium RL_1_1]|nr:hypothetical protein [Coleofasciculaceae cyanobacterium RL_1_1]